MSDRMKGPRSKVERPNEHFADLQEAIRDFIKTNPYEVAPEDDVESGQRLYKVTKADEAPERIALIAGDAIHNLRLSLDLLFCQLVTARGNALIRDDAFPIADTAKVFEATRIP